MSMQSNVSTNIHIPTPLWKAIKIKAAEEGKTMRELILEGLKLILEGESLPSQKASGKSSLLKFAGTAAADPQDGSREHDRYLDE